MLINHICRRFVMIVIPLALVCLEWNHPSGFSSNVFKGLSPLGSWWKNLHIIQSFLFGAMAAASFYLTWNHSSYWAVISRFFIWLFAVCYLVFDSTAGIAVGFMIEQTLVNPSLDKETMIQIIQSTYKDPVIGGSGSLFSLTGSWAWSIGIGTAVLSLFLENNHLPVWKWIPPLSLLLISAYSLNVGHYSPYGPIAFGCFAAAALWFEVFKFGPASK